MFCLYFILSLCVVTYCKQDDEWFNCKPKPGCSVSIDCSPNDVVYNDYPMLCQQNKSSSSADSEIDLLKKKNAELEKYLKECNGKTKDSIKLLCPVKHENKCFLPAIGRWVDYDGGVAICESVGGHLANIYSQTHVDYVMKYIREYRKDDSSETFVRLGMKYNPKANKLFMRNNGTDAPAGLKWYDGFPYTVAAFYDDHADYTNVILAVSSDQSSIYQYLFNTLPSTTFSVLCEIE